MHPPKLGSGIAGGSGNLGMSAPPVKFLLETLHFRKCVTEYVNYAKTLCPGVSAWNDLEKALNNAISDALVFRFGSIYNLGLIKSYQGQIEEAIDGLTIPKCLAELIELCGEFTMGDLHQHFIPELACQAQTNTTEGKFRFLRRHAICPFEYRTLNFTSTSEFPVEEIVSLLSGYGEVSNKGNVVTFQRQAIVTRSKCLASFYSILETKALGATCKILRNDAKVGSPVQMCFYGADSIDESLHIYSAFACGPSSSLTTRELIIGAALFSPTTKDFKHTQTIGVRKMVPSPTREQIFYLLITGRSDVLTRGTF